MLYWEHCMAAWHSQSVLASDPAFQRFSIFNERKILDVLMSPPEPEQAAGSHLCHIIGRNWPEGIDLLFNPRRMNS